MKPSNNFWNLESRWRRGEENFKYIQVGTWSADGSVGVELLKYFCVYGGSERVSKHLVGKEDTNTDWRGQPYRLQICVSILGT